MSRQTGTSSRQSVEHEIDWVRTQFVVALPSDEAEALLERLADHLICHDEPTVVAYGLLEAALGRLEVEPRG